MLASNPKQPEFRLTLIDGFAGGGVYLDSATREHRDGTPLLMLRTMREAEQAAQVKRSRSTFHLDVEYFFIEKCHEHWEYLQRTLRESEFRELLTDKIALINGGFLDHVDAIIARIKERKRGERAIFVLDQFGYSDVPLPAIRKILCEVDQAEVILTFATDSLIDYMTGDETCQKIFEKVGLNLTSTDIPELKLHSDWRRAIQQILHRQIQEGSQARFYTPFFIRPKESHRDFWLVHLSGHARARDVMVEQHWSENTSFAHYGRAGLGMLGYDQSEDSRITMQRTLPAFYFDDTARALTIESLTQQLGAVIPKDGILFSELFESITNDMPATSEILKEALVALQQNHDIEVFSPNKEGRRRSPKQITNKDVVRISPQRTLFVPPRKG